MIRFLFPMLPRVVVGCADSIRLIKIVSMMFMNIEPPVIMTARSSSSPGLSSSIDRSRRTGQKWH